MSRIIFLSIIILLFSSSTTFAQIINTQSTSTYCKSGFYAGVEAGFGDTV